MSRVNCNSLFFRFSLTLVLSTLVFQVATMALVWWLLIRPLVFANVADLVSIVELAVNDWQSAPAEQRPKRTAELATRYRVEVGPVTPAPVGRHSWLPLIRNLETRLGTLYDQPVHIRDIGDGYRFTLERHGETLQVQLPSSRINTRPMLAMVAMFLGSLIASVSAAYYLACRLTLPLREAAEAAARVGRRELPQLPIPKGADELVDLAESFNRMAQEVDNLINNRTILLAGVSHDLRSPLARMRLAVELARDTRDWALIDDMQRHIDVMSALLQDYLEFAQGAASGGQSTIKFHDEAAELERDYAPRLKLDGTPLRLRANRIGLLRILRNTLENALRYSGEAPVELGWKSDGNEITITVADRGPGLPRPARELLQPFTRGDASRNVRTGGLGLGLAICQMIAHAQGWSFDLESREGGGTVARLVLPRSPC